MKISLVAAIVLSLVIAFFAVQNSQPTGELEKKQQVNES